MVDKFFSLCFQDVLWQGPVAGTDAALETFKAEKAYPISKLCEVSFDRC